jgi:hypothetical protein
MMSRGWWNDINKYYKIKSKEMLTKVDEVQCQNKFAAVSRNAVCLSVCLSVCLYTLKLGTVEVDSVRLC